MSCLRERARGQHGEFSKLTEQSNEPCIFDKRGIRENIEFFNIMRGIVDVQFNESQIKRNKRKRSLFCNIITYKVLQIDERALLTVLTLYDSEVPKSVLQQQ